MSDFLNKISELIKNFFSNLCDSISTMTPVEFIVNILDILLMSLLIFAAYKFISKRRAGQLAIGLIMVILLAVISSAAGMKGITFILSNFYQVGILAVIIVFQPELRAALEKVGGNSIMNGIKNIGVESKDTTLIKEATDELVSALFDLSKTKTGAIVVLENTTKLGEYIKTGKIVDGKMSKYLLENIFYTGAPLHDGAVIVRDLRIHAASCFLPLATNEQAIGNLGSRHRAAVGISENSDALVLVVSEETGIISVARQGNLTRQYSYDRLYGVVYEFFIKQNAKQHIKKSKKDNKKKSKKESEIQVTEEAK